MTTKMDKIRQKIAALQDDLKEAEAAEAERQKAKFMRLAKRTGLLDVALSDKRLESEFRAIVARANALKSAPESGLSQSSDG